MFLTRTLIAACATTVFSTSAFAVNFMELYKNAKDTISDSVYKATGSVKICAANEVKSWVTNDVIPAFKESAKGVSVRDSDLHFDGSGELADKMNEGNPNRCDIVIYGSDVAALRSRDFKKKEATSLAFSPSVMIGVKSKLDAARKHLGKAANETLTCADLAKISRVGRGPRIGTTGRLSLEMSTSNSGQSTYFSCVYSLLDSVSADDVEKALNDKDSGSAKEKEIVDMMSAVTFESLTSSKVKNDFVNGKGQGVGAMHIAIGTYELYVPEIQKTAAANNVEVEVIYPAISILNNFPAQIVAQPGSSSHTAAQAFLKTALSKNVQAKLVAHGMRPAVPGITLPEYMNTKIEVGDSPTTQRDLIRFWEIVKSVPSVKNSGVANF